MISAVQQVTGAYRRGGTVTVKTTVEMRVMSQLMSVLIPTARVMATSSLAATDAASAAAGSVMVKMTVVMDQMNTRLSDVVSSCRHFPLTFTMWSIIVHRRHMSVSFCLSKRLNISSWFLATFNLSHIVLNRGISVCLKIMAFPSGTLYQIMKIAAFCFLANACWLSQLLSAEVNCDKYHAERPTLFTTFWQWCQAVCSLSAIAEPLV